MMARDGNPIPATGAESRVLSSRKRFRKVGDFRPQGLPRLSCRIVTSARIKKSLLSFLVHIEALSTDPC